MLGKKVNTDKLDKINLARLSSCDSEDEYIIIWISNLHFAVLDILTIKGFYWDYCYFNFNEKKDLSNIFPLYGGFTAFLLIFCIQKKQAYDFTSILGNSSNELAD